MKAETTIAEARELKLVLEHKVKTLLREFEIETNLQIYEVDLIMDSFLDKSRVVDIEIEARIKRTV